MPPCAREQSTRLVASNLPWHTRRKDVIRRERQECHMARTLDSPSQHALVLGTGPCLASGPDLASVGDVALQNVNLLVADGMTLVSYAPGATTGNTPLLTPVVPATA